MRRQPRAFVRMMGTLAVLGVMGPAVAAAQDVGAKTPPASGYEPTNRLLLNLQVPPVDYGALARDAANSEPAVPLFSESARDAAGPVTRRPDGGFNIRFGTGLDRPANGGRANLPLTHAPR